MAGRTILTLGIDPALFRRLHAERIANADVVEANDVEAIMDLLWVKGHEVEAVVLPVTHDGNEDLQSLLKTLQSDWPMIELLTV